MTFKDLLAVCLELIKTLHNLIGDAQDSLLALQQAISCPSVPPLHSSIKM